MERQQSVLGMTLFDLPGIVHKNLTRPMIRYAFLGIDDQRIKEILALFPELDHIFTEKSHKLPYKAIFSNDYFVIYQTRS